MSVRYAREYRDDPEKLQRILVHPPVGGPIPLEQIADISFNTGAPMVRSEGGKIVGYVFVTSTSRRNRSPTTGFARDPRDHRNGRGMLADPASVHPREIDRPPPTGADRDMAAALLRFGTSRLGQTCELV